MKRFWMFLFAALAFSACQKDEVEGPELQDIFGEFAVINGLNSDRTEVDFAVGETVEFSAEISIRTDWEIHIVGQTTGARKVIEGRAREVAGDVARWNGTITFAPIFAEEVCSTYMVFKEYPDTLFGPDITIATAKPTDDVDLVISDFEDDGQGFNAFTEPASFNSPVSGQYFQNLYTDPPGFTEVNPAEGNGYYMMSANNAGSIFICGFGLAGQNVQDNEGQLYYDFGTNNPDNIYLNLFVFGYGEQQTVMAINFQEDDNLDGTYDRFTEGSWGTSIEVTWEGWRLVSIPMSSTVLSTVGGFGNIDGTGQKDMDRVINMEFLLLAVENTSGLCGYGLDFANITLYEPYSP